MNDKIRKAKYIYTVTQIKDIDEINASTVGWFPSFKRAEELVERNACDLHEMYYKYIVIEKVEDGMYSGPHDEHWYRWNGKRWTMCGKPIGLICVCSFSM
jgi:hypothetical protein